MKTNRLSAGVALSIVLACGMAQAGPGASSGAFVASPAQKAAAVQSFAWLDRDAGLLDRAVPATHRFVESPGVMERQARMVAKVRDRADMARQAAIEVAQGAVAVPRQAAAGGAVSVAPIWDRADERLVEARARLAPVLIEAHPEVDTHAFRLPEGWTEEQIADVLMATGDYEYVEPDWRVYPLATVPNDPQFSQQWHHRAQNMNSVGAWDFETGGNEIIVASCDTGVIPNHPDLNPLVPGFNATTNLAQVDGGVTSDLSNGHGTLVAGSMAARGNNGVGVAGVGWNFRVMPVRVSDRSDGVANLSDILQGARWASDNGAFVANCSYGGGNSSQANTAGNYIRQRDALLVFATGNDGVQDQTQDRPFVTLVGATTSSNAVANFSNYGVGVDVVAPGVNIRSTTRTGGYANVTGTSFAAPLTAGVMGLVRSANPDLTADQVEQIIKDSAMDIGAPGFDIFAGHGMVNTSSAVQAAIFGPSVVDLPFSESFSSGELTNSWRDPVGTPEVNDAVGDFALNLDGTDSIRTVGLRAAFLFDSVGEIAFGVQHRGVEAGKSLLVEYADIIGNWQTLTTVVSDGADTDGFVRVRMGVPLFGLHDELKIRFVAQGADATDDWYIDDVLVAEFVRNTIPWQVGFENGVDTTFDWASSQASATTEAPNTPEGDFSAKLVGSASMTSRPVDITSIVNLPYFRIRTLHTGVEAGESLTVEYLDLLGNWQALLAIPSDGANQSGFDLHQVQMPFAAFGTDLQVRITANGSDSTDVWYVDDVAISEDLVIEPPSCPQDIDGNGLLNFFDISGFLGLFNAQDPVADWDGNGQFNFFDISSYLASFNAGCP
jgi:subtilisin family serine protease